VYQIYQCGPSGTDLCIRSLEAGEENDRLGVHPDERLLLAGRAAARARGAGRLRPAAWRADRFSHECGTLIQQSENCDGAAIGITCGASAHVNIAVGDHRRDEFVVAVGCKRPAEQQAKIRGVIREERSRAASVLDRPYDSIRGPIR
jgi:hypothetical protein